MSSNRILNTESSALEFLKSRIGDFAVQWSIYVATKLKIADLLHDGPRGSDFLAENASANPRILFDVLRTLVAHEILEETEDGLFSLNEISSALQTEKFGRIIPASPFRVNEIEILSSGTIHEISRQPVTRLRTHRWTSTGILRVTLKRWERLFKMTQISSLYFCLLLI